MDETARGLIDFLGGSSGTGFCPPHVSGASGEKRIPESERYRQIDQEDDHEVRGLDNTSLYARSEWNDTSPQNESHRRPREFEGPVRYLTTNEVLGIEEDDICTSCSDLSDSDEEENHLYAYNEDDDDDDDDMDAIRRKKRRLLEEVAEPDDDAGDSSDSTGNLLRMQSSQSTLVSDSDTRNDTPRRSLGNRRREVLFGVRRRELPPSLRCFGCKYGSPKQEPINGKKINTLLKIFDENYCRTSNKMLARMCHQYFKREIYNPMRAAGKSIKIWRTREILDHFENHIEEPRIFIGESIKKYKQLSRTIHEKLFKEVKLGDEPGASTIIIVDKDNIKNALLVDKRLMELYSMKPENMNFYSNKCAIDFSRIGNYVNIHKNWSLQ